MREVMVRGGLSDTLPPVRLLRQPVSRTFQENSHSAMPPSPPEAFALPRSAPMTHLPPIFQDHFDEVQKDPSAQLSCVSLQGAVQRLTREHFGDDVPKFAKAEWMAVALLPDQGERWGTHFGPLQTLRNDEGGWSEAPSIQSVDGEILDYWEARSTEATHPVLKARFADAVWDLSKPGAGRKPPFTALATAVSEYLRSAELVTSEFTGERVKWLRRALQLSIQANDASRIAAVVAAALKLAEQVDEPRAWHFAHGAVFGEKKTSPTQGEQEQVIAALERHCETELDSEGILPFQQGALSLLLIEHCWRHERQEDAKAFAARYAEACLPACQDADAMSACRWLTSVENMLLRYELKEESKVYARLLEERSASLRDEMVTLEHSFPIDWADSDELTRIILSRPLTEAIYGTWIRFIPKMEVIRERLQTRYGFITSFFPTQVSDASGRVTHSLPPFREDPDAYLPLVYNEDLGIQAVFLARGLDQFRDHLKLDIAMLMGEVEQSPVFTGEKLALCRRGLQAYLDDDFIVAIHVLTPVLEAALRQLLFEIGRPTWQPPRDGSNEERHVTLLDKLLRDPALETQVGEDVSTYLRMLLSDKRGWNVRNEVSHGLLNSDMFGRSIADRLFHVVLGLSLVRRKNPGAPGDTDWGGEFAEDEETTRNEGGDGNADEPND